MAVGLWRAGAARQAADLTTAWELLGVWRCTSQGLRVRAIFLLCLSTHNQANKQCSPLAPGLLPAVLVSPSKGQNQLRNEDTGQGATLQLRQTEHPPFLQNASKDVLCGQRCPDWKY
ncbi:hypothetical protein AV530_002515 [Patagioenas fasciata monilis]|uniref:Uncharacterized protein n=1 Tax=Patagioenas fasciata monilis TaxID=372326 RepID=A0A1V4K6P6_PATFA|nr:hypothetical protein AV530_002515 [Patagioenas fasciata monilis]